jgi:hypothetical protein
MADAMRFVGTISLVVGVLNVVAVPFFLAASDFKQAAPTAGQGVFTALIGWWTRSASFSVARIVETRGNDITNLMEAMGELRRIYMLQKRLLIISMVFVGICIFVLALAMASRPQ